jgi:hypothetical protein
MTRTLLPFLLLSFNLNAQTDATVEPATMLEVTVGGKVQKVSEGSAFDVNGTSVTARVSDVKTLATGAVDFDYPRHFAFEYDGSVEGMRQWTLDGNNVVLMLFEIDGAAEVKDFEEGMAERFGKKNCKGSNTSLRLGGKELQGRRLDITLAGTALSMDMLKLPESDGKTRVLFIQDTKTDSGGTSDESKDTVKLLDRTIRYN